VDLHDPYEGSPRQRRRQRRVRIVSVVLALSLLVPIVLSTVDAVRG
jgi:predicted nucleic acid-binding Zn ribbon protein